MIRLRLPLLATLIAASSLSLSATPGTWQAATLAEFLRGEVEHLSIDEHGRLMLGPRVERVHDTGAPFVWTMVQGRDGAFYLGTGNDGKVLKVDARGTATVVYDSAEMEVHALALAADGTLYAGTSPDGRIYKVDAQGTATPFFDPDDKYIWSLVVDKAGVVYAGTGDKGTVYKITPDGKGTAFFSTKATHATTLALDPQGHLVVGTGAPGRVFRVDATGKGFLVLDTAYQEVRALRFNPKGVMYVAAQSGRPAAGGSPGEASTTDSPTPTPVVSVSTEITAIAILDQPVSPQPAPGNTTRADSRAPTGAIYRVLPDGLSDEVWDSRDDAPYDMAFEADGSLIVATGGRGRIFRLSGEPIRSTLLTRVTAQQGTVLARGEDRMWVATSNPGLLLSMSSARAERGTWESDVKDARMAATWGTLTWKATIPAGARVELFTRSGNTRTPDETWSDWTGPYETPTGSPVRSPKARYFQMRAVLSATGESPVLTSVSAAYLQRNVRPQVASITVHPPGVVFQKPFSSGETEIAGFDSETQERRVAQAAQASSGAPSLGRRTYQRGLQTFAWKGDDENGDDLVFDVLYRREGETSWKILKSGLTDSIFVWDTSSVPNGAYVLKVVASDERSNPADLALKGELESAGFDIDNSPPQVVIGTQRRDGTAYVVSFEIRDADSAVSRVEYSLDAQRWQTAFPRDGILDGRQEQFELRLDEAAAGRVLVVRAFDALLNAGTAQVQVLVR